MSSKSILSRRRLVSLLTEKIGELGYEPVPGVDGAEAALYYKPVDSLVLTLGFEFSTRYKDRFTGSFYLSRSFTWAYIADGFPLSAYKRVGHFLSPQDRERLLEPVFCRPGMVDAWWIGFTEDSLSSFVEAVRVAEPGFLSQEGLQKAILDSPGITMQVALVDRTIEIATKLVDKPETLIAQPKRTAAKIPPAWYWAAELALREIKPGALDPRVVERIAVDAWRVSNVLRQEPLMKRSGAT